MQEIKLTPTSYIVLGLLGDGAEATPYDLKGRCAIGIGNLWSLQHTQLYAEPERLAKAGYLTETQEDSGRRRKMYRITDAGRAAFEAWLASGPTGELPEIRDINLLKVYFGADSRPIATRQAEAHRAKLREYTELQQLVDPAEKTGPGTALRAGLIHERGWVGFWDSITSDAKPGEQSPGEQGPAE